MDKSLILEQPTTNSIFQEPWWLDAVAPGQWDELIVKRNNAIVARMPYVIKKRYGFTLLITPNLTQTLGPWIQQPRGKYVTQLAEQRKLLIELIDNLPPFDYFHQNFNYSVTDWLPFYWRDFQQTTMYTYMIEDLSNIDSIWDNMKDSARNIIRKAKKADIKVEQSDNIDLFLELNKLTFTRQGMPHLYSVDYIKRFDAAAKKHNA